MGYRTVEDAVLSLLRWLMVPVVLLLSFYVLLIGSFLIHQFFDLFCPEDQRSSGVCIAPWFGLLEEALLMGFTLGYGFVWVLLGALVAPVRRTRAAPVLLAAGGLTVGVLFDEWWGQTMALAVAGGVLANALLCWRAR